MRIDIDDSIEEMLYEVYSVIDRMEVDTIPLCRGGSVNVWDHLKELKKKIRSKQR